ncbi:MAG: aldo/keto reductase [Selenomonadaceae bacterium]|nr:aldo/keto reductase [Selenomonadaceae bacterium]
MAYLGEEIKKLGFGLMRLPKLEDGTIDLEQVKQMVDLFLSKGFTYFDTAWAYPGSEEAIRAALIERYPRDKFTLATKNAAWINCKTREDAIAQFETSLARTGAGYFDFYLLHNLGETRTEFFERFKMWDFVFEKKREGLIKHVGFSVHSTPEELDEILTAHPEAEFVQLQINYADWENPAIQSRGCYEVARKHGKPIVIMEPIKGGMLATPPDEVQAVFNAANPDVSLASWAIRFAASLDGVITVLSGMSTLDQMKDNVAYMENFVRLDDSERATVEEARRVLASLPIIPCTTCDYCAKVCPQNIGISGSFTAYNILTLYKNKNFADNQYNWQVKMHGKNNAGECIKCGACEKVCPQHIKIRGELVKVAKAFGR